MEKYRVKINYWCHGHLEPSYNGGQEKRLLIRVCEVCLLWLRVQNYLYYKYD